MAILQAFNSLSCGSRDKSVFQFGFFGNRNLLGATELSALLQLAAARVLLLQTALGTVPLTWQDWVVILLISSSIFIADALRKSVQRQVRPEVNA